MSWKKPWIFVSRIRASFGDASAAVFEQEQFSSIMHSTQSLADCIVELQDNVSNGTGVGLSDTGVQAGHYAYPSLDVGSDGRLVAIKSNPAPAALPIASSQGLVLTSSDAGPAWAKLPATLPAGGSAGQVLGIDASGLAWTDLPTPTVQNPLTIGGDNNISATTFAGRVSLALNPTGVFAGTYSNPVITVDAAGRVTSVVQTDPSDVAPVGYSSTASAGAYRYWRFVGDMQFMSAPAMALGGVEFASAIGGPAITGTPLTGSTWVGSDLGTPVSIVEVRVTSAVGNAAPLKGSLQHSDNGAIWSDAFSIPPQPVWADNETRSFTMAPFTALAGDVTGEGTTGIVTTLSETGVTAGSYTTANVTVDAKGRVTAISNGVVAASGTTPDGAVSTIYLTSPDGVIHQVSVSNAGTVTATTYTPPVAAGFWRIYATTVNRYPDTERLIVLDMQFRDAGGTNLSTGGTAFTSDPNGSYSFAPHTPEMAFDGDATTYFESYDYVSNGSGTLGYAFTSAVLVGSVAITCNSTYNSPRDFVVQYATALSGPWTTVGTFTGTVWTSGVQSTQVFALG